MQIRTLNRVIASTVDSSLRLIRRFQTRDLERLTDHLASLLEAGLPVRQAVMHLRAYALSRQQETWLNLAASSVENGTSLSDGWRPYAPRLLLSLVAAGEATGNLAATLRSWSLHVRARRKATGELLRMLSYPALLICLMTALLIFVARVVLPMFIGVYVSMGLRLTGATAVIAASLHATPRGLETLAIGGAAVTTVALTVRRLSPALWSQLLRRLPGHQLWRLRRTSTWSQLLRLHLNAGVALTDTLTELSDAHHPLWVRREAEETLSRVLEGHPPAVAFSGPWDPLLTVLLRWAEQTGEIGAAFARVETYTRDLFDERLRRLIQFLEPVLLFMMGGLVSACMYVVYIPMYDMMTTVSSGHWS